MALNQDFSLGNEMPDHVHEVLQLLAVMAGDHRFEEISNEAMGGEKTMSEYLDKLEARGEARAAEKYKAQLRKKRELSKNY